MPSGYKVAGTDLDDIFDPYVEGTKPAATGKEVAGVDLNQRYAPREYGAQAPATGHKVAGDDVNTLWAAKATASYLTSVGSTAEGTVGPVGASVAARVYTDGRIVFTAGSGGTLYYAPVAAGAGTPYEFRMSGSTTILASGAGSQGVTGKGGVALTGAGSYDTGWQDADSANDFLYADANCTGSLNGVHEISGNFHIQVRRKSDSVVVQTRDIDFVVHTEIAH